MKNFKSLHSRFYKVMVFFFLLTIAFSCEEKQEQSANQITQEDIEAMKENHLIKLNDAVKMYDKYEKLRIKFFKDSLKSRYGNNFKDTRMVWFDIKDVRAYLKYLEENTSEAEGLAFYFGVNSGSARQGKNHQSFFIAPTLSNVVNGDTIQSGYTEVNGERVFLYEKYKNYRETSNEDNMQKASFFNLTRNGDGYLFNDGSENPPFPNN